MKGHQNCVCCDGHEMGLHALTAVAEDISGVRKAGRGTRTGKMLMAADWSPKFWWCCRCKCFFSGVLEWARHWKWWMVLEVPSIHPMVMPAALFSMPSTGVMTMEHCLYKCSPPLNLISCSYQFLSTELYQKNVMLT